MSTVLPNTMELQDVSAPTTPKGIHRWTNSKKSTNSMVSTTSSASKSSRSSRSMSSRRRGGRVCDASGMPLDASMFSLKSVSTTSFGSSNLEDSPLLAGLQPHETKCRCLPLTVVLAVLLAFAILVPVLALWGVNLWYYYPPTLVTLFFTWF